MRDTHARSSRNSWLSRRIAQLHLTRQLHDAQHLNDSHAVTVPDDIALEPAQQLINLLLDFDAHPWTGSLDFHGKNLTSVRESFDTLLKSLWNPLSSATSIDFSDNNLDTASVDRLISIVATNAGNYDPAELKLDGGTNAPPTQPVFIINFNNLVTTAAGQFGLCANPQDNIIMVDIEDSEDLSDSYANFAPTQESPYFIGIGIAEAPTKQQIINRLVELGAGKITDLGGLVIRIAPIDHALTPLDFSGMAGSHFTAGNNDLGGLRVKGWTVATN